MDKSTSMSRVTGPPNRGRSNRTSNFRPPGSDAPITAAVQAVPAARVEEPGLEPQESWYTALGEDDASEESVQQVETLKEEPGSSGQEWRRPSQKDPLERDSLGEDERPVFNAPGSINSQSGHWRNNPKKKSHVDLVDLKQLIEALHTKVNTLTQTVNSIKADVEVLKKSSARFMTDPTRSSFQIAPLDSF